MRRIQKLLVAVLLVLPLILAVGLESAQAGSTQTGVIRGKVVDKSGQPLPGVTILLKSSSLIRDRATVTDSDGNFFAAGLPPGKYSVQTQQTGFLTIITDTDVRIDKTTVLAAIVMEEGELRETVTVTAGKPVVDKTKTETAVVVDKEFTENLPVGRSYQSLIDFAPGVNDANNDGNPNILGGTRNSNLYLIDGISGNDPVTGTFGFNLNYDAIEAVDIKISGISAEYGQTQGGLTNLITKAGGNEFTGSLRDVIDAPSWTKLYTRESQDEFKPNKQSANVSYRRPSIPGRNSGDDAKTNRVSATLGGPVVSDSAWFFLAYDRIDRKDSNALANPAGGPNMDGTYGDFFDGNFTLGKATWQVTNDHRVQYTYSDDPATVTRCYGQLFFGGPCYEDYNVDLQGQGGFLWNANWNAVWSPNVVTNVRVARFKNTFLLSSLAPTPTRPGLPLSGTGDPAPLIDLTSGSLFDASIFSDDPEDRDRKQAEASATIFFDTGAGNHTFKIGADYQENERIGASIIDGNALFYSLGWVTPPPGLGGAGDPYDVNNRVYFYWIDFAPPGGGGPINEYTVLYVNDDWQLNDHWSFNLGLRYEDSNNENDVGEAIIDDEGFAPRLGATYDVTGQGEHVLKATAARYLDGIDLTTLSPFVRAAGGQSSYDIYVNSPVAPGPPNWLLVGQVRPDPDTSTFDPGLEPQYIDEYTLGYEWLATPTLGLGIKGVYRDWDEIITQSFTYDYSTGVPRKILRFANNDNAKREYKGVLLTVDKRLADNWQLLGSYVWSEAEGNVTSDLGFDTFQAYPNVSQTTENRFGRLSWDSEHQLKLRGFYQIPLKNARHRLSLGGRYDYRSGSPFAANNSQIITVGPGPNGIQDGPLGGPAVGDDQVDTVTVFHEQRGKRREPHLQRVDLSFNYGFAFNQRVNFEARFEVFNVTNENKPRTVNSNFIPGAVNYTFGFPTSYGQFELQRNYRLQLALKW